MNIALVCNPVAGGWSPLADQGWSGGEEILTKFARALAHRGHNVCVFYDGEPLIDETPEALVTYLARGSAANSTFDLALYFKCPELYDPRLAPRSYCWTDQERPFVPDPFVRVVACSEYLRRWLASAVPRAVPRLHVIPYGIDCAEVLAAGEGITRNPLEVLHCASPDRGLDVFLDLWPRVLAHVPDATLTIAYGWELFDKYGGSPALKAKILGQCAVLMEQGAQITMRRLSRLEMHQALHRAAVYAYWCTGGEQFGLTALKAQLAGCVPVVKPWGALHETVVREYHVTDADMMVERIARALTGPRFYTMPALVRLDSGEIANTHALSLDGRTEALADQHDWPKIVDHWEALWAQPDHLAPIHSNIVSIPGAPPFAEEIGWNVPQLAHGVVSEWMQALQPKAPWLDPSLGYPPGPAATPADADAVLVGYSFEDTEEPPGRYLRKLLAKPGTPVMLLMSHGTWRAAKRQRACSPADLRHLVGSCPEYTERCFPLNAEGDGVTLVTFRFIPERIVDHRDWQRVRSLAAPRETFAGCLMVRNVADVIGISLGSLEKIADEVCIVDTGSTDATADRIEDFRKRTGIPVQYETGTSPRFCYDCGREHAIGEMGYGHRVAGFETARNQSIALARADHIGWLDADEEFLNVEALGKFLRPNSFAGYGIPQHHHSVDHPAASKIDYPVRVFRRKPEGVAGLIPYGPEQWPTFHSGLTARFTGIVHEHPGFGPTFTEGLGPVMMTADVWIAHRGYYLESHRRKRFVRNWPLMVADRQKYPARRLGHFLFLRDLSHQARYLVEQAGGLVTPEVHALASDGWRLFCEEFAEKADAFTVDAVGFGSVCAAMLQAGIEYEVLIKAKKPEISADECVVAQFSGRFANDAQMLAAAKARLMETSRWEGQYL